MAEAVLALFSDQRLKKCTLCKVEKPTTAFSPQRKYFHARCKACRSKNANDVRGAEGEESKIARRKTYTAYYASKIATSESAMESRRQRGKALYSKDSVNIKYRRAKSRFGVSREQIDTMISVQRGLCANRGCGIEIKFGDRMTHIDHDHVTGRVRGLLCFSCNVALGNLKESKNRMLGLIEYLETHSGG